MHRKKIAYFENLVDKDQDGQIDLFQKELVNTDGVNSSLDDILKENLFSIKGRRQRIRNFPTDILPTKLDDDDDPPSEDEDGEETSTVRHGVFVEQYFHKIRDKCLQKGNLFVDPMFPANNASLFLRKDKWGTNHNIEWKRPGELCESPRFFVDGPSRFDIQQGELGDCWLVAAMANLTLNKKLFYKYPESNKLILNNIVLSQYPKKN